MRALLTPYSSEGLDPAWLEPAPKQVGGITERSYERSFACEQGMQYCLIVAVQ